MPTWSDDDHLIRFDDATDLIDLDFSHREEGRGATVDDLITTIMCGVIVEGHRWQVQRGETVIALVNKHATGQSMWRASGSIHTNTIYAELRGTGMTTYLERISADVRAVSHVPLVTKTRSTKPASRHNARLLASIANGLTAIVDRYVTKFAEVRACISDGVIESIAGDVDDTRAVFDYERTPLLEHLDVWLCAEMAGLTFRQAHNLLRGDDRGYHTYKGEVTEAILRRFMEDDRVQGVLLRELRQTEVLLSPWDRYQRIRAPASGSPSAVAQAISGQLGRLVHPDSRRTAEILGKAIARNMSVYNHIVDQGVPTDDRAGNAREPGEVARA